MANFTEKAIADTFVEMLNERPLDKITVRELSERCGISRNTFYYHFHDVYDLLDSILRAEEARLLANLDTISTLRQALSQAFQFVTENWQAIRHVYNSVSRDSLSQYLFNAASMNMRRYLEGQRAGLDVSDRDFDDLVRLYACMIEGVVLNGLREGISQDAEEFIANAVRLLEGTARMALENASRGMG